jgi:hypothetical protein
LSQLPEEIAQLNRQKRQVQEDLRETLHSYLEQINSFSEVDETVKEYEFDELFQKIDLPDEYTESSDDEESEAELYDEDAEEEDELALDDLGEEDDEDDGEPKEDLRKKLEEGGIAYLSDDS